MWKPGAGNYIILINQALIKMRGRAEVRYKFSAVADDFTRFLLKSSGVQQVQLLKT